MSVFIVGIDDIATETQISQGWCYFVLSKSEYMKFEVEARAILSANRLKVFHGKKFKKKDKEAYLKFLHLIRKFIETSGPSLCACTLNNQNWNDEFSPFCKRVAKSVFNNIGVGDQELIDVAEDLAPPLFTLQRLILTFGNQNELTIAIDSDTIKKKLPCLTTIIKRNKFTASFLLEKLYNAYKSMRFPESPKMLQGGIEIVDDAKSIAVQAADVVGNFSTAFIYYKLGHTSNTRKIKGEIFEDVFGDFFKDQNFCDHIELSGNNDLLIKHDGAYTFQFGLL